MADSDAIGEDESAGAVTLPRSRLLSVSAAWNVVGYLVPLLVGLVAVPILVHYLGTDRFGLLSLAWVVIGSFSIIDLGLGRTLTQFVASTLAQGDLIAIAPLVWSSLLLMLMFGAVAGTVIVLLAPWLVHGGLRIPMSLRPESLATLYLLALALPIVLVTAGLRGVLEAQQQFALSNLVRIPLGIATFAGPLLLLPFSVELSSAVAVLVVGRYIAAAAYLILCLRTTPGLARRVGPRRSLMGPLLRMGAWISTSNLISAVMVYIDRFVIGAVISVGAVAYYTVPYDIAARLLVIPGAIAAVLFPAFATSFVHDRSRANALLVRGTKYLFLLLLPLTIVAVTLASDALRIWLGADFSRHSAQVLQLLTIGVFFNGLANVPLSFIQGVGRADISARLHLVELPIYLVSLLWLIAHAGIEGAAIAYAVRSLVDMAILFIFSFRLLQSRRSLILRMGLGLGVSFVLLAAGTVPTTQVARAVFLTLLVFCFAITSWFYVLSPEERRFAIRPFAGPPRAIQG